MAWRPNENLVKGELDNTVPGKVTGWLEFLGGVLVQMDLAGDFDPDIRGKKIRIKNPAPQPKPKESRINQLNDNHPWGVTV